MKALSGTMRERAAAVIAAGSDVALHCSGDLAEMESAAAALSPLAGKALARAEACLAIIDRAEPFDVAAAESVLAEVIAGHTRQSESV